MIIFFFIAIISRQSSVAYQKTKQAKYLLDNPNTFPKKALNEDNSNNDNNINEEDQDDDDDSLSFILLIAIAAGGLILVILLIVLVVIISKMTKKNGITSHGKYQVESSRESLLGDRNETAENRPESHSAFVRPESTADFMRPDSNAAILRPESTAELARPDTAFVMPESSLEILESSSISSVDID